MQAVWQSRAATARQDNNFLGIQVEMTNKISRAVSSLIDVSLRDKNRSESSGRKSSDTFPHDLEGPAVENAFGSHIVHTQNVKLALCPV